MRRRDFIYRTAGSAAALAIARYLGGCRVGRGDASPFAALRDRYFLRTLELNPVVSTYLGGDGYSDALTMINGKLRNYGPEALQEERDFYHEVRDRLSRIEQATLGPQDAIDFAVLQSQLAFLLHQVEDRRYHQRSVDTYVAEPFRGVDWQIQQMRELPNGLLGTEDEWSLVVTRLEAVPAYLQTALANLSAGKAAGNLPDRRMVERDGIQGSAANAEYFGSTLPATATRLLGGRAFATTMGTRIGNAGRRAASAYEAFARKLASTYNLTEKTDRYAVGEEEYDWRLRHCLNLTQSAAELYDYGAEQIKLYQSRIYEVAEQIARDARPGLRFVSPADKQSSVRGVMDHLSQQAPADDEELFRWYREVGERAVAYGRTQGLFDVPKTYRLDVVPTPPVLRSTIDAAYYAAPPLKRSGVGRFYLTPTGNDPAALRLNNRASVATTAVHEGFPGHDWHYKYMTEHAREIPNIRWLTPGAVEDSSSMWQDSMAAEGWALYSEELMAEPTPGRPDGFYTTAEHFYELQAQLLRAVRVRVDVGLHTGRLSFTDARDYFTEQVNFYPEACAAASRDAAARAICASADRAIYRYSKWPTQAITYNLGKNEILALRDASGRRQGGSFDLKRFHERLMRMGTIPAGYFRSTFLNETS
jgi:uncharacterized protein (DUF885 family)